MEILIKSRAEIEKMIFSPKTAVISITDANWTFAEFKHQPDYLLQLAFDDVDNDIFEGEIPTEEIEQKYHMISDKQANDIADFYHAVVGKIDTIICQCEHGQSRSAAVAAALMEYEYGQGIRVFIHDDYFPNKAVFKKVIQYL